MGRDGIFAPEACALHHSEAVLLVDDYHAEIAELHGVFDQRMGADKYMQRAVGEHRQNIVAFFFTRGARE